MRRVRAGERGPLWIRADVQTHGRGRSGRHWTSPKGNLFTTLLFAPDCPLAAVPQLALLTGIAVYDAIASAGDVPALRLKWPNDVLVGDAKVAGILCESVAGDVGELAAMIGIGINLHSSPHSAGRAATHLMACGIQCEVSRGLELLDAEIWRWLSVWDRGKGFSAIRSAWLERAGPLGEVLTINTGSSGPVTGRFAGLGMDGALIIEDPDGRERRYTFGDVAVAPRTAGV